ncbi:MAG: TssN family type VI secretion system protein [Chitinophagaceae bacterium]
MLKPLFFQYLLLPLLVLVLLAVALVLKRKNEMLSNKKLIVFILLAGLIVAVPGFFGIMGNNFSPWGYVICQAVYLLLGIAFVQAYYNIIQPGVKNYAVLIQLMVMLLIIVLGAYLFALVFNLCSDTGGGYVAATCLIIFPLPSLFYWAYLSFVAIPFEIFSVWHYAENEEALSFDGEDFNRLMVLQLEFSRHQNDKDRIKVKAKAPPDIYFGDWFKKFVDDYNYKFPNQQISVRDNGEPCGWIFYCKKSFLHRRRLLDPALSIADNRIKEHVTIVSKRVLEHKEEKFYSNKNKLAIQL